MPIPLVPANLLVASGNGQTYISWSPSVGATSAINASSASATSAAYLLQRSYDGINFLTVNGVNSTQYYDILGSSAGLNGGPSTGIVTFYQVSANNGTGTSQYTAPLSTTLVNSGQVSLGQIRLAAQQRADMVNNNFVSVQEWNSYITRSYTELYDMLVAVYGDEYEVATPYYFTTDGRNPSSYGLPANLYKLMGVDLALNQQTGNNTNGWLTLAKFNFASRNRCIFGSTPVSFLGVLNLKYRLLGDQIEFIPTPMSNQTVRLWYVPKPNVLLADSDTLDGVSGWEELVIIDSAIKALQKEESDVSVLMAQKSAMVERIKGMAANRDAGFPDTVTDVRRMDGSYFGGGMDGPSGGY